MKHPYRKIAHLFLLAAMLVITGIHGYHHVREYIAKWALAHRTYFRAEELMRIAVPQAELISQNECLLNEEEFNWRGQIVDVLYRQVRSDTRFIYGFRNEAETGLSQQSVWLSQWENHSDKLPDSRTKQLHWESAINLPDEPLFASSPSGWLFANRTTFSYVTPHFAFPCREVPCSHPIYKYLVVFRSGHIASHGKSMSFLRGIYLSNKHRVL